MNQVYIASGSTVRDPTRKHSYLGIEGMMRKFKSSGCKYLLHYTPNASRKLKALRIGVYAHKLAT